MCREMIGEDAAKKLLTVPLSNDTVSRRISEMASDIHNQVLERMKSIPFFSIQLQYNTAGVFNRGSAAPLWSATALQGVCDMSLC